MLPLVVTLNGEDFGVGLDIVLCVVVAFMLALFFTLTLEFALVFVDMGLTIVGDLFLSSSRLTPALPISSSVFRIISSKDPRSLSMVDVDVPDRSISFASRMRSADISDKSAMIFERRCISFAFLSKAAACCDCRLTALLRLFRLCATAPSSFTLFCTPLFAFCSSFCLIFRAFNLAIFSFISADFALSASMAAIAMASFSSSTSCSLDTSLTWAFCFILVIKLRSFCLCARLNSFSCRLVCISANFNFCRSIRRIDSSTACSSSDNPIFSCCSIFLDRKFRNYKVVVVYCRGN